MFGTTQSSFGTPGGNAFGKPTGGGLFGNSSNTASTGNSLFGGNNNTGSSTTGGGLFGNNAGSNNSNNSSGGLFGNTGGNNAASTGTSLFGNSNNNNNNNASSGGLFGNNNNNNNNTAAPTGGLFGNNNNNNTTAPTGGLFGNNNNNNTAAPTGGLFGNSNNNTAAPTGGLFGNNNNSTGGGFANKPSTPTTGGGLFGNNNSAATSSSGGLFGSNTTNTASTGGLFGNTANNTATNTGSLLFGTKNSTTSSGGLFGNTTTAAPTNAGLFGNTQSAPKGGLFGNTVSTPSTGGLFGNNAITNNNINLSNAQLGNVVPSANTNSSDMLPLSNITHLPALTPAKKFPLRNGTANSVIKSSFSRVSKPRTFQKFSNQSYSLHNSETPSYINDTKDLFLKSVVSNQPAKPLFTSSLISDSRRSDVKKLIIAKRTISSDEIRGIKRDQSENALPSTISSPSITNTPVSSSKSSFSPFPSHGGPISPQFKRVYEINKTALDEGYWIYPPLKELFSYGFDQLANVTDLSIGRKNHGKIQYTVPVDLSEIRNLGDIMGNLVVFDGTTVCVYPDDSKKAPAGTALNMPAVVTLENVFIKHPVGSKIVTVTDPINPKAIKQTQLLRKKVEEQGGEFITYDVTHGIFVFKVSHFSTWGFSEIDLVYDDEEDAEMDLDEPDTQPIEAEDMDEDEDEALVHKASIFKQFPDEQGLIIAEPDTTISDEIAFSEVARSDNWLEQLEYAGDFTSSFAQLHERNTKELTGADLDDTIFGGIDTLTANSTTVQYAEAAEKLRLPSAFSPHTVAKFTFNNDLLVKHRDSPSGFDIAPSTPFSNPTCLAKVIELSTFETRANGFPKPTFHDKINFQYLENNIDSSEKELWSLASVLFDPISLLGLEPIPEGYSESTEIRIVSQYRTKLLSKWLKRNVASNIEKQIAKSSSSLLKPFIYLTGNRITKAALAATQSKNPHLAALISLLGTDDTNIRKVAKAQLENWSQTGSAAFVPSEIQNVYELLAGNANVKTGVDLTWLQVFGLHLWYDSTVNESIDEAVKRYAPASKNFTTSIEFELLKLVDSNITPVNVLNFRNAWVSWALYIVLYKSLSLYNDEREVFGDQISLNFALELEKAGNVVEAAFVICHISRDDLVQRYLQDLVSRQVDLLTQDVITKLVSVLHVPEKIIREAVALKHRAKTDHVNECLALIDANDWTEAHKVLSHYVAPQCVISNDITTLYNILIKFSTNDANNVSSKVWANGGQVYLDYVLLYERIEPDQAKLSNEDSTESFGKLAERFRRGLAAWQPNAGDNFKVGVSRTLLESFSRRYIENRE